MDLWIFMDIKKNKKINTHTHTFVFLENDKKILTDILKYVLK